MKNNIILFPTKRLVTRPTTAKVPAIVRKLASSLMVKLSIQPGMSLVCILGNGSEHSNQQALQTWLLQHDLSVFELQSLSINELSHSLETYLKNQLDNMETTSC